MPELADEQAEEHRKRQDGMKAYGEIQAPGYSDEELSSRGYEAYSFDGAQIESMVLRDNGTTLWIRFHNS